MPVMTTGIHLTTDHDEIRRWVEDVGGRPVQVRIAGADSVVGVLGIDLPGGARDEKLEPISWEDWFGQFDDAGLALLYEEHKADGSKSTFSKLVQR